MSSYVREQRRESVGLEVRTEGDSVDASDITKRGEGVVKAILAHGDTNAG